MDTLKQVLAEILRPIVMEAVREAMADVKVNPPKRYYTVEEAMAHLKISRATFYRRVGHGEIEILKIGHLFLLLQSCCIRGRDLKYSTD